MSSDRPSFQPEAPLADAPVHPDCRACVTIPARNEADAVPRCLEALSRQVTPCGPPLPFENYEILLLLNNCTDDTAAVVRAWHREHPRMALHVIECTLPAQHAHVGTARRLLMDTAWHRMRNVASPSAILSTDADTEVGPDWIGENLRALQGGAAVVGGAVSLSPAELADLPSLVRLCYRQDREYARLIAQLEHLLDPCVGDAWPRHLDHFGSSLACTPEAYAQAGGMPAISPLEDEAFVDRVRRANLVLRHEPRVRVATSARLDGRATVGLAGQLRLWSQLPHADAHTVPSADFLAFRFRYMRRLRELFHTQNLGGLDLPTQWWKDTFQHALAEEATCPGFLGAIYCDILIREQFPGQAVEPIRLAIAGLRRHIRAITPRAQNALSATHGSPDLGRSTLQQGRSPTRLSGGALPTAQRQTNVSEWSGRLDSN